MIISGGRNGNSFVLPLLHSVVMMMLLVVCSVCHNFYTGYLKNMRSGKFVLTKFFVQLRWRSSKLVLRM